MNRQDDIMNVTNNLSPAQKAIGAPPATLIHVGPRRLENLNIQITDYSPSEVTTQTIPKISELSPLVDGFQRWIEVSGLHDHLEIEAICQILKVDPLIIEDLLNTESFPKVEEYDDYIFISTKTSTLDHDGIIRIQQASLIIAERITITFLEDKLPVFQPIHKRLSAPNNRLTKRHSDYFGCAILDVITDNTLAFIDQIEERLEAIEDSISLDKELPELKTVHGTRREIAKLHRGVRPFKEITHTLCHTESSLIHNTSSPYFKNLYDHAILAVERTEFLREHATSIRELYFTTTSHRMNEVMKVLAAISVIFLPLTFLAGLYGMNFDVMPELHWKWGYPTLLIIIITIGLSLARFFRKRGWL